MFYVFISKMCLLQNTIIVVLFLCSILTLGDARYFPVNKLYLGGPNTIVLLKNEDGSDPGWLREAFYKKCKDFYDIQILSVADCTVQAMEKAIKDIEKQIYLAKKYLNVINLNICDYYESSNGNDNVDKTLIYTGDTEEDCWHKYENSTWLSNCTGKVMTKAASKINSGDLLDFVWSMRFEHGKLDARETCLGYTEKNMDLKTVLICLDEYREDCFKPSLFRGYPLHVKHSRDCAKDVRKYQNNLLAIIAPKPFPTEEQISVSTIFYRTPHYLSEDKTDFPNSENLKVPWHLLKYGFLEVMKTMNWRRVAIVSDDSPYSVEFERHLTELFRAEGIMFTVEGCNERKCDFSKALESLLNAEARIVIANVDEDNKYHLINQYTWQFTWLTRDWMFTENQQSDISISITLGPTKGIYIEEFYPWDITEPKDLRCSGMYEAFNKINDLNIMYITPLGDLVETLSRQEFYGNITYVFKGEVAEEAIIQITEVRKTGVKDLIASSSISESNHAIVFRRPPFQDSYKLVDVPNCLLRSNDYYRPCDDLVVLSLILVVVMFFTTLLLIMCYFDKTSPIHNDYNQMQ